MADIVNKQTRSRMMSGIRGKNTQPELRVRSYLHRAGLRFSLHGRKLPGRPDLVLAKHESVVFVHGCFWHQHASCRYAYKPASNSRFWNDKFVENTARDQRVRKQLRSEGWRVFVIWECEAGDEIRLRRLVRWIRKGLPSGPKSRKD
jgi:DNA mismatch endonuclease (patch repair protein)